MKTDTNVSDQDSELTRDYLRSEDLQIVIASPYEDLVRNTLEGLAIVVESVETSVALGLSLLTFADPGPGAIRQLADQSDSEEQQDVSEEQQDLVGLVIGAIKRAITGGDQWRWVPTMGRNRLVGHVDGTNGHVIVRSDNDPTSTRDETISGRVGPGPAPGVQATRVAVVDTSIGSHPALLKAKITPRPTPLPANLSFRAGHSTFITGLIQHRSPDAAITITTALDSEGRGTSWDVADAIVECGRQGAQIINLSLACYTFDGQPPLVLAQAIDRLPPDTLVVAAAGNTGSHGPAHFQGKGLDLSTAPAWPAALDDVVAVGASDSEGQRAAFSPDAPWVDVLAPGVDVRSILPSGVGPESSTSPGYATWSGTSFAAAQLSGMVAAVVAATGKSPREAYLDLLKKGNDGEFTFLSSGI